MLLNNFMKQVVRILLELYTLIIPLITKQLLNNK